MTTSAASSHQTPKHPPCVSTTSDKSKISSSQDALCLVCLTPPEHLIVECPIVKAGANGIERQMQEFIDADAPSEIIAALRAALDMDRGSQKRQSQHGGSATAVASQSQSAFSLSKGMRPS